MNYQDKPCDRLILFGGGLDSGVMCAFAHNQHLTPHLLFFDYGQKAFIGEDAALLYLSRKFEYPYSVVKVPPEIVPRSPLTEGAPATEQAKNEVPARNLLFLAMGFSMAMRLGIREMWIGADPPFSWAGFADSRQPTFDGFNLTTAYAYGNQSPRVVAPLLSFKSKLDYLKHGMLHLPELFDVTFSCYESTTVVECGHCIHCTQKEKMREAIRSGMHAAGGRNEAKQ